MASKAKLYVPSHLILFKPGRGKSRQLDTSPNQKIRMTPPISFSIYLEPKRSRRLLGSQAQQPFRLRSVAGPLTLNRTDDYAEMGKQLQETLRA